VRTLATLKKEISSSTPTYTRASTSEAQMSDTVNFAPVSPTSKVYIRSWFYARLLGNTTLAVDDQAGSLAIKASDGTVWVTRSTITFGDANRVQVAANVITWQNISYQSMDASGWRQLGNGLLSLRLYGNPNYPNLTLEQYLFTVEFEEFE
jgi:hypothetical protein